ncbi:MAG: metal-dependent hydrolase [Campylobacterota bacterium]|nr:metal-dependent hydrolase [Campylobacterota bacterium]
MASFEQHVNGAVVATGVAIVPLYSASLLDVHQSLIVLALGIVGGVLPDLDSDNSKPLQIVFKIFSIFLPLIFLLALFENESLVKLIGYWVLASILLHLTIFKLFTMLTVHRGVIHSIPMGIVFGQITIYIFFYSLNYDLIFSTLAGIFLSFGFMVHLLLDELVSLNALGLRMKKSFGTAFKLYDRDNLLGTLILYMFIVTFFYFTPVDTDVFFQIFEIMKNVRVI